MGCFHVLFPWSQDTSASWYINVYYQPGGLSKLHVPSFGWGIITQAWLPESLAMWLNSVSSSFPSQEIGLISCCPKPWSSSHIVDLFSMAIPILLFMGQPWITKTPLLRGKLPELRGSFSGTRNKGQSHSLLYITHSKWELDMEENSGNHSFTLTKVTQYKQPQYNTWFPCTLPRKYL